ncbi:MAG TPA: hypothetical protein VMW28_01380 [Pelolinea sp.]|nr:hypothetical protein [Pelolinea sp.]
MIENPPRINFIIFAILVLVTTLAASGCFLTEGISIRVIPSPTPLDWNELPQYVRDFLQNETYADAIQWMQDRNWEYSEINGLPPGLMNASPSVALAQMTGECFETAAMFSLLARKLGQENFLVHIQQGESVSHDIQLYRDNAAGQWGYVDYPDFGTAIHASAEDAILAYLEKVSSRLEVDVPVEWMMFDWRVIEERGVDWITTGEDIVLFPSYAVDEGTYHFLQAIQ